jgi:predicted esterase
MRQRHRGTATAAALVVAVVTLRAAAAGRTVDAAFAQLWSARTPPDAAKAADAVVKSGVEFDAAFQRLKDGRVYSADVPKGIVRQSHAVGGTEFPYTLDVPETYTPSRRYQVRVQLHGGVGRPDALPRNGIGQLAGAEQIYVLPTAWSGAEWWTARQIENIRWIIDSVKRTYNVDENHIVVSGVSDGGTGAYYTALRDTTPYAAFLPLNGYWAVLRNPDLGIDVPLFPGNLRNKPFFIVNGERDPLYPTAAVDPAVAHYKAIGMTVEYRPQAGAGHNTRWWPTVKDDFDAFARSHPRNPLPDTLTWETSSTRVFNRAHWLVIDRLGTARNESALDDPNLMASAPRLEFGVRSVGNRINRVVPGSNAERIGLRAGDALVRVNDESVRIQIDVEEVFARVTPGERMTLLVARNNEPVELAGVYAPQPATDPPHPVFSRGVPSGRVDLVRDGNTVTARTRGVTAFRLLLSPDRFDFDRPIVVKVNGRTVHDGRVAKDVRTLAKWADVDHDRTMLFGAELHVALDR